MSDAYYDELEIAGTEIGVVLEDSIMVMNEASYQWVRTPAKICVPVLIPDMDTSDLVDKYEFDNATKIQATNYIELLIPDYLYPKPLLLEEYEVTTVDLRVIKIPKFENRVIIPKGTKLVLSFVSGELDLGNIKILGKYE